MINTKTKDEGSTINCAALLDYNGYITIHLSAAQSATFVTQGANRQNELTLSITFSKNDLEQLWGICLSQSHWNKFVEKKPVNYPLEKSKY